MDTFKFLFVEACKNLNITPCLIILTRIEDALNSSCLDLTRIQLQCNECKALGTALTADIHIQELILTNCRLSPEDFSHILCGLEKNKFITSLTLNGNDIRSSTVVKLGKLLRHNNHIQNLSLEWNGLGVFPEKFAVFCEGLCANSSLKSIDLRNNQLNHMCAQSIANMMLRNSSLQKMDVRWNNLGLLGGRYILKVLRRNTSIVELNISGNNLPNDLLESLEMATSVSALRSKNANGHIAKSKFLAAKLQEKEQERISQLSTLIAQLERKEKDAALSEKLNQEKLSMAEDTLAEKDRLLENFTSKIQELETEVWSKSEEIKTLSLSVSALETRNKELISEHKLAIGKEFKAREEAEKELGDHLSAAKDENEMLKQQVQDLLILRVKKENEILKLKDQVSALEEASKKQKCSQDEQISNLKELYAETEKENAALHQNQISRLKAEQAGLEKVWKLRASVWVAQKESLEEELKVKTSELTSLNSQSEEKLIEQEKRLKAEHEIVKQQLEERIQILEESNEEQNEHLQSDLEALHQLKMDITSMDLDLAEHAHEIQRLKQCLAEKEVEMKAQETKIRLEVKLQLDELQKAKDSLQLLTQQNSDLHNTIQELEAKHRKELEADVKVIQSFKEEVERYEQKVKVMSEANEQRDAQLREAFKAFLAQSS